MTIGLGADHLLAGLGLDLDGLAVAEARPAGDRLDAGTLQEAGDAGGQAADDAVLPGDGPAEVERGRCGRDAEGVLAGGHGARAWRTRRRRGSAPWTGCSRRSGRCRRASLPRRSRCRGRAGRRGWRRRSRRGRRRSPGAGRRSPSSLSASRKIMAGVSSSALMRWTKTAASQPSMTRWSKARREVHHLARHELGPVPVRADGDLVDADDRHLGVVDDRRGHDAAHRPERGDGDGRAGQLLARRGAGCGRPRRAGSARRRSPRGRAPRRGAPPAPSARRRSGWRRRCGRRRGGGSPRPRRRRAR